MSQEDLTFSAPAQFEGTYGSRRSKANVQQKLRDVAQILDNLAAQEGIACVMISAADYEKDHDGVYLPLPPRTAEDRAFFRDVITPIIEKRLALRRKWFEQQDAKMGFTLSA